MSKFQSGSHWGIYTVEVEDSKVVGVEPFEKDPNPSPLIESIPSAVHAENRITSPMVRKGWLERGHESDTAGRGVEPFVAVSWDTALDLLAKELKRVKDTHGNQAMYASSGWGSAGCFHSADGQLQRFFNCFGGFVRQVTNYSFGAATVILPRILGTMEPVVGQITSWPTIAQHTDLMILFGGMSPKNAQVNKDGVGAHDSPDWLKRVRDAGVEFVCVSPLRDDGGELNADWLPIRPSTDTAMMLGLMHTLVTEDLYNADFLSRYCVGFERFRDYVMGETDGVAKTADWASQITEIDALTIRTLARRMAAGRTMVAVSWSVQRADHGEQPYWMAATLAAMLGQIGLPGGGFGYGYGSSNGRGMPKMAMPSPKLPTGNNPVEAFIPVARVTDMLLNPGAKIDFNGQELTYPDIHLVYWCGGNAFHKQQDINKLLQGWRKPDTIVVHEPWWTAAARRADIVLPCTTTLERNDIGAVSSDRFWYAMQQAIPPVGEARTDHDIYAALAERLGFRDAFTEGRNEDAWLRHLYEETRQKLGELDMELPGFDRFWENGHFEFPIPEDPPVLFEKFREDPDANPLKTPSGKIEIFSETIDSFGYDDCLGHPAWFEPAEWLGSEKTKQHPLHLISNQPRTRLHSQLDVGVISRGSKISGREPVWINPQDAEARGILEGDVVRIFNDRGACLAGAFVTPEIRPGVVQLSTGSWYDPLDPSTAGSLDKHGNPNVLTMDKGTSKLAQSSIAQTALVEIEPYEGLVPEITVFAPPVTSRAT